MFSNTNCGIKITTDVEIVAFLSWKFALGDLKI